MRFWNLLLIYKIGKPSLKEYSGYYSRLHLTYYTNVLNYFWKNTKNTDFFYKMN